jgi:hypothetical protein
MPQRKPGLPPSLSVHFDVHQRTGSRFIILDIWRPLDGVLETSTLLNEPLPIPVPRNRLRLALEDLGDLLEALIADRWGVADELGESATPGARSS